MLRRQAKKLKQSDELDLVCEPGGPRQHLIAPILTSASAAWGCQAKDRPDYKCLQDSFTIPQPFV